MSASSAFVTSSRPYRCAAPPIHARPPGFASSAGPSERSNADHTDICPLGDEPVPWRIWTAAANRGRSDSPPPPLAAAGPRRTRRRRRLLREGSYVGVIRVRHVQPAVPMRRASDPRSTSWVRRARQSPSERSNADHTRHSVRWEVRRRRWTQACTPLPAAAPRGRSRGRSTRPFPRAVSVYCARPASTPCNTSTHAPEGKAQNCAVYRYGPGERPRGAASGAAAGSGRGKRRAGLRPSAPSHLPADEMSGVISVRPLGRAPGSTNGEVERGSEARRIGTAGWT